MGMKSIFGVISFFVGSNQSNAVFCTATLCGNWVRTRQCTTVRKKITRVRFNTRAWWLGRFRAPESGALKRLWVSHYLCFYSWPENKPLNAIKHHQCHHKLNCFLLFSPQKTGLRQAYLGHTSTCFVTLCKYKSYFWPKRCSLWDKISNVARIVNAVQRHS